MGGLSEEFLDLWLETEISIETPSDRRLLQEDPLFAPSKRSRRSPGRFDAAKVRKNIMSSANSPDLNFRKTRSSALKSNSTQMKKLRKRKNVVNESTPATTSSEDRTVEVLSQSPAAPAEDLMFTLTRRECFSAAHRLHNSGLTEKRNRRLYGKCNNENGHGHNYEVKVTLRGPIDPETGMIYNLSDLKSDMKFVLDRLDHKHLDKDVSFFKNHVSSVENIALAIHVALRSRLVKPELLYKVKVTETENNSAAVISS